MPRNKTKTDKNQMEFDFNKTQKRKRKYPKTVLEARLNKLREANRQRLAAEEKARHYQAIVKELKQKYGVPTKKNLKRYLEKMKQERQNYEAISRSFARTGSDKEFVEIHKANAEMVGLYIQQINKKFSQKRY
jgi:hypothetical protein